jgi:hypothetical protein
VAPLVIVAGVLISPLVIAAAIMLWAGASFLLDAWHCRHPTADLLERLERFQPPSVADEAQRWLRGQ